MSARPDREIGPLGHQILKEWAVSLIYFYCNIFTCIEFYCQDITGIDKNQLLDDSPEARVTQLQTLRDIVSVDSFQLLVEITFNFDDRLKMLRQTRHINGL